MRGNAPVNLSDQIEDGDVLEGAVQKRLVANVGQEDVLLEDGLTVGGANALQVQEQGVFAQLEELRLFGTNRHNQAVNQMRPRLHAVVLAHLREAPRKFILQKAPVDAGHAHERSAPLLLN